MARAEQKRCEFPSTEFVTCNGEMCRDFDGDTYIISFQDLLLFFIISCNLFFSVCDHRVSKNTTMADMTDIDLRETPVIKKLRHYLKSTIFYVFFNAWVNKVDFSLNHNGIL